MSQEVAGPEEAADVAEDAAPEESKLTTMAGFVADGQDPVVPEFALSITKSMNKTGYYSIDHPEGRRAMMGVFDNYMNMMEDRGNEFSFQLTYSREGTLEQDVALFDGKNPIKLMGDMLTLGAAQTFVPKFVEYFHRQGLLSFTIGKTITQEHFEIFIERMTRTPDTSVENPGEELSRDLAQAGVRAISVVFDEDRISGLRTVPWRAELALTRLRKDVRMIPMLANATVEEMRKIKSRLMDDILRGIQEVNLMIAVAQNLGAALSGQEEVLTRAEAEHHLINGIGLRILPGVAKAMASPWVRKEGEEEDPEDRRTRARMIQVLIRRLLEMDGRTAASALVTLYNAGYIDLDSMGEGARNLIRANALAEAALESPDRLLAEMNHSAAEDPFGAVLNDMALAAETLIERSEFETAAQLVGTIHGYAKGTATVPAGGAHSAFEALERIASSREILDLIGDAIVQLSGPDASCVDMMRWFEPDPAIEVLVIVLQRGQTPELRHWAVKEIIKRAYDVPTTVSRYLGDTAQPWYVIRNLLTVIRKVGTDADYPQVAQLYEHDKHQVRTEALVTMAQLAPERAMRLIERALTDADQELRRTASLAVANATKVSDGAVNALIEMMRREREADGIRLQAAASLAAVVRSRAAPNSDAILNAYRDIISDKYGSRMHRFKRFAKSRHPPPPHLLASVVKALGLVGQPQDQSLIAACLEDDSPDVRDAAHHALGNLRATSSPPPGGVSDALGEFLNG